MYICIYVRYIESSGAQASECWPSAATIYIHVRYVAFSLFFISFFLKKILWSLSCMIFKWWPIGCKGKTVMHFGGFGGIVLMSSSFYDMNVTYVCMYVANYVTSLFRWSLITTQVHHYFAVIRMKHVQNKTGEYITTVPHTCPTPPQLSGLWLTN